MNIILYDGVCNLCKGIVLFLRKRDKKSLLRFAALQSEAGQALMKQYGIQNKENITLYYICEREGESKCHQKSTAILHILRDLGGLWRCLYPLILIPVRIRDAAYLFIAHRRYRWFGKLH